METKYLDIHIIYSDKDKKYLVSLLKKCRNFKIKNSVNDWKISIKAHDNSGKNNIGQFQRRLSILKNYPEDHYIWFIDGDDEIIDDANLEGDAEDIDIYIFANKVFGGNPITRETFELIESRFNNNITLKGLDSKENLLDKRNNPVHLQDIAGGALWNKWIKAKTWKNVYEYLKSINYENIRPNSSEDCFYALYALKYASKLFYSATPIYFYRNDRSLIFNASKNIISYKAFLNFRHNHKEVTDAIVKLDIPYIEGFLLADRCCQLEKALLCVEIKKALQNMVDEFGKDVIINTLKEYDERIIFPFLTVKKLAYKYLTK